MNRPDIPLLLKRDLFGVVRRRTLPGPDGPLDCVDRDTDEE